MKKTIIKQSQLILTLVIAIHCVANACTCYPYEPVFCKIVNGNHHIVRAVIVSFPEMHLMEVQVIENIHQELNTNSITVLGQDGFNCAESLEDFSIQDTLIMALEPVQNYWYLEGACGLHFLRYENGMVLGQATETTTIQTIENFRDNLFDCSFTGISDEGMEVVDESKVRISPNPVVEQFQISTTQNPISGYEIYSSNGQLISSSFLNQSVNRLDVNSNHLPSGVYFVKVRTLNGILTKKILKI